MRWITSAPILLAFAASPLAAQPYYEPLANNSVEQALVTNTLPDGGLSPVVGVQSFCVFRSSRDLPEQTDGKGWTYNHHVDLGVWKGRFYVAWDNGEKDEDTWPARQLIASSEDGVSWSSPTELFPAGVGTSLRMYFFHAPNGRMLVIGGLRTNHNKLEEARKGGAIVRELRADHTLGPILTLIDPPNGTELPKPQAYTTSDDAGFVEACRQLLDSNVFLEQQDYGVLLGDRRMDWHQQFRNLKAFSFMKRKDGAIVGIGKQAWSVASTDDGKTWSRPVRPRSIRTGNAKSWLAPTSDGRYAMVYIPQAPQRFPLAMMTSDDGVTFKDLRVVHGEVPMLRYPGLHKSAGPQYVRGVSMWSSDGSRNDSDLWVVYSVNKEDIWVSRIPVPVQAEAPGVRETNFNDVEPGPFVPRWNTYRPKWADVRVADVPDASRALYLEDRDPYDHAMAELVFPTRENATIQFKVMKNRPAPGTMEIELIGLANNQRPVRIAWMPDGHVRVGESDFGVHQPGQWLEFRIVADAGARQSRIALNGGAETLLPFADDTSRLARLRFRTGAYREIGEPQTPAPQSDRPVEPAGFLIDDVSIE